MKYPMRIKSIDEAQPPLFAFGYHQDGTIDLNDGQRDVFTNVPPGLAAQVIRANQEYMTKLYSILGMK